MNLLVLECAEETEMMMMHLVPSPIYDSLDELDCLYSKVICRIHNELLGNKRFL